MRAFTLLETLLMITLLVAGASFSAAVGIDSLKRSQSRYDLEQALAIMRRARALAQAGVCLSRACDSVPNQGVYLDSSRALLFEGSALEESGHIEEFPLSGKSTIKPVTVVFRAYSGNTEYAVATTVLGEGGGYTVSVSELGVIDTSRH